MLCGKENSPAQRSGVVTTLSGGVTAVNTQQVGRAGELYVAAEIHRRGGYAVTFAGNMPGIDILASNADDTRRISIQVKTKTRGTWHASTPRR